MKKLKIGSASQAEGPLASIITHVEAEAKSWTDAARSLHACSVPDGAAAVADPFRVAIALKHLEPKLNSVSSAAIADVARLRDWVEKETKRQVATFESDLRIRCDANGLKLDGRFPQLVVNDFLTVSVDQQSAVTQVGFRRIPTLFVPTIVAEIVAVVRSDADRPFHPQEFIEQLYQSYRRAVALAGREPHEGVLAKALLPELTFVKQVPAFRRAPSKTSFVEYSFEQFGWDLGRLFAAGIGTTKTNLRLQTFPVSNSADAVPVLVNGSHQYIGRIKFSEEANQ